MQSSNAPAKIPLPFANAGTKNTIPTASQIAITPGAASLTDGFPPLTRTPIAAGGVPPFGADMNGILFELSANTQWENAGGFYPYDAAFSTAIGGYPKGAVLQKATLAGLWISTTENNITNPDTGGAGWLDLTVGRLLNVQYFFNSATYTPTPGTNSIIIEGVGGAGAGGGVPAGGAGTTAAAGGGAAGSYGSMRIASVVPTTVTIGAGGLGVAGAAGGAGSSTSFGSFASMPGGGGAPVANSTTGAGVTGSSGATSGNPTGANLASAGGIGGPGIVLSASAGQSGKGGDTRFGAGGQSGAASGTISAAGSSGVGYGAGGAGALGINNGATAKGGDGSKGVLIVYEYA